LTTGQSPEVSAILVTDNLSTIRKTLSYLRNQAGAERMEIVIAATRPGDVEPAAPELQGFGQVRVVPIDDLSSPPLARAEAVRAASSPLVLFAETHSYPRPGYVEALVRAHHAGPWAVVGPSMGNANPDSALSWANLLLDYGRWVSSEERGVIDDVPGHNAAYKREALLEFGDDLSQQLRADSIMHADLRTRGYELYLEPEARIDHLNVSLLRWSAVERFHSSRHFAGLRARGWPLRRRLLYIGGAPLIPAVRLRRILGFVRRSRDAPSALRLLPALGFVLTLSAFGELAGYAFGPGRAGYSYEIEVYRSRFVRPADRVQDADEDTWPT
jgi:glycosyl transferase family 2